MWVMLIFILIAITIIFPCIWIIIPIGLFIVIPICYGLKGFVDRDEARKMRQEECRKRRYGDDYDKFI